MNLVNLPEEILILIVKQLDFKTVYNLYNTCKHTRKIVCMFGVVRECQLSMNTLATVQSLRMNFFKVISGHLQELNMCAVHDLTKTSLLPAMKKLKNLITLDVSHTSINIPDFFDLYQVCPTIKNITIDFGFKKHDASEIFPLSVKTMKQYKNMFKSFDNIHFYAPCANLIFSGLAVLLLEEANLNSLKFTILNCSTKTLIRNVENNTLGCQFKQFNVYFLCTEGYKTYSEGLFSMLDLDSHEMVIISFQEDSTSNEYTVFTTSNLIKEFLIDDFGLDAKCFNLSRRMLSNSTVAVLIWNRETTSFNVSFFNNLCNEMQKFFPYNYLLVLRTQCPAKVKTNWFRIMPTRHDVEETASEDKPPCKKRRNGLRNFSLNYDELCKDKQEVQLSLHFNQQFIYPIALPSNCDYLKKLTSLNLTGWYTRYCSDFFMLLFQCCNNLVTLNVESLSAHVSVSKFLHLSGSLKNLRLIDMNIGFTAVFNALIRCDTLENIHLYDFSILDNDFSDPSPIFQKCDNLYFFLIHASMSDTVRIKRMQMLKKAKSSCGKKHLDVTLLTNHVKYTHYPSEDVFQLNPMKDSIRQ